MRLDVQHCPVCPVRGKSPFCDLEACLLEKLDHDKTAHRYGPGQLIFAEGNPPLAIYCIHSGTIKLYRTGRKGEKQVIRTLGAGSMAGYRALLASEPYSATAEAIEETVVCTIPREAILDLLRRSQELAFHFLGRLARDLRHSEDQMMFLTQKSVRQRTAHVLLLLAEGASRKRPPVGSASLRIKRIDLAQMIGTSPETLSRTLHSFERRGVVRLSRAEIGIPEPTLLKKIAAGSR